MKITKPRTYSNVTDLLYDENTVQIAPHHGLQRILHHGLHAELLGPHPGGADLPQARGGYRILARGGQDF